MSHFTLLVVTPDRPDEDLLERLLQPWHEYESTGIEDEHVVEIDETDRVNQLWAEPTEAVRLADGTIERKGDPQFWSKATNPEFTLPPGASLITLPRGEIEIAKGETIEGWATSYGGWRSDGSGRFFSHTNPQARWDWWVVGGRWSGFFRLKPGVAPIVGQPGAFGPMREGHLYADCARLADIDIEAMRHDDATLALETWDKARDATTGLPEALSWDALKASMAGSDIDAMRRAYHQQPAVEALRVAIPGLFDPDPMLESLRQDRETIASRAREATLGTHAYLRNGEWREQGQMGWFGISRDDQPDHAWYSEMAAMIASLDPSTWLTVIDCHI